MNSIPLVVVDKLRKVYTKGKFKRRTTFQLEADFTIDAPMIVAMIGPNGAGKTTLLELIAGEIAPTSGNVICKGKNIHKVKLNERHYLVNHHYPPSQFLRFNGKSFTKNLPAMLFRIFKRAVTNFLLKPAGSSTRTIHLYDELKMDDGYFELLSDFFCKLQRKGHFVLFCTHPNKPVHLEIMRKICTRYFFVHEGVLTQMPDFDTFLKDERVRRHLGDLVEDVKEQLENS